MENRVKIITGSSAEELQSNITSFIIYQSRTLVSASLTSICTPDGKQVHTAAIVYTEPF